MDNPISFMSANLWAREVGWDASAWLAAGEATSAWFSPLRTFRERFDELLGVIGRFDTDAVDMWVTHLDPAWATDEHLATATELLSAHGLRVASYAGGYGDDVAAFERSCRIAVALGRPVLGGNVPAWDVDRAGVLALLERYDLRLAFENHPEEHTPDDIRRRIGDAPLELVGTAVDTGWWGTNGYDAAKAIEELGELVFYVHLKDIRRAGEHETCTFGDGVVPVRDCLPALRRIGYTGPLSVENGPDDHDPSDEIVESIRRVREWMAAEPSV